MQPAAKKQPLTTMNRHVTTLTSLERIYWAHEAFGGKGLYAISSFGVDSALLLRLMQQAGVSIPVVTIDTGFWFMETGAYKEALTNFFGLDVHVYGPSTEEVQAVTESRLWETDLDAYHEITKLAPARRAVKELGVKAFISGVRGHQTRHRASLRPISDGKYGEARIHPVLEWSESDVADFFAQQKLPRHPLYWEGYGSVGDWTTTKPGKDRNGRSKLGKHMECGLHLPVNTG